MELANNEHFSSALTNDVMIAMKDAPKDNPFQLMADDNDAVVFRAIDDAFMLKNTNNIEWQTRIKYVAFITGSLFNHGYTKGGVGQNYLETTSRLITSISDKI
eukprot:CAMPEP_0197042222 /NCGR_PEP_ID=MMETSP1384-20130603/18625_1 /TAXON_ID=29189 /ORGANISM="Ammonia sp." /LENGTH=102 /DNA_ID=CAMNT_0042473285 /DNA_START=121 /DNA_END=426 /DNA_ORIENTATION=+